MFIFSIIAIILIAWKEYEPDVAPTVNCEDLEKRDAKISINFNAYPNPFRETGFEYYIPSPDIRWGDTPGTTIFDETQFSCTIKVTSPNCPNFYWYRAIENITNFSGNIVNIKLPPSGYDAQVNVTYIERGENFSTQNYNKPAYDNFGNQKNYSRIRYEFQMTYLGGWSNPNIAQPIYLDPIANEGYNINPSTGRMQLPPAGGKADFSDLSGINVVIDLGRN